MKLIKRHQYLGEGVCEFLCDKCSCQYYHDLQCKHNNNMAVCPGCGNVCAEKDVEGLSISEDSRQIITAQNPDTGEKIESE